MLSQSRKRIDDESKSRSVGSSPLPLQVSRQGNAACARCFFVAVLRVDRGIIPFFCFKSFFFVSCLMTLLVLSHDISRCGYTG